MAGMSDRQEKSGSARRVVAIVNPATRRNPEPIIELLRAMAPAGVELDVRQTVSAGTTTAVAREALAGADLIVAVGGDGTVAAVASALDGADVPLGIVPAGSTNIIARELGIPTRARDAVGLLYGDHCLRSLDMGRCGDQSFLHMAGAGFDSRLFAATNPALKRRIGWLAYLSAGARNLTQPSIRFTIQADDARLEVTSPLVLVANGGSIIAPGLTLYPGIRKDDGLLDVLVFTPRGPFQIARTLGRGVTRGLARSPFVLRLPARRVEITTDPPVPIQLDGDVASNTPALFTIQPGAIRVVVPDTA
jgi:diacylglycerol kinase (ATP)